MSLTKPQNLEIRKSKKLLISFLAAAVILLLQIPAFAQEQNVGENTGLPLPRWASLKSNHINARSGPGDTYPVKAVYKRAGLPVEIVSEFKLWREIVDIEGEHNWVHKAMLSGSRHAIIKEETYSYSSTDHSSATAKLEKDAQVSIGECAESYCEIHINHGMSDVSGWVEKSKLWGVYPNEIFD
jgi:SH3-like domain-containing protein